jgi:hypothetical protein
VRPTLDSVFVQQVDLHTFNVELRDRNRQQQEPAFTPAYIPAGASNRMPAYFGALVAEAVMLKQIPRSPLVLEEFDSEAILRYAEPMKDSEYYSLFLHCVATEAPLPTLENVINVLREYVNAPRAPLNEYASIALAASPPPPLPSRSLRLPGRQQLVADDFIRFHVSGCRYGCSGCTLPPLTFGQRRGFVGHERVACTGCAHPATEHTFREDRKK